jgi:hypothetical protein
LESAAGVVGGNLGQQLGAQMGNAKADELGLTGEKRAALVNAYQNTGAVVGGMLAGAAAAGATGQAANAGALLAAAQGGGAANSVDTFNRQLHASELEKLLGLAGEFKRRLKSQGIEISEKEAFYRLLAQAAKDVDTVQFKDRKSDVGRDFHCWRQTV